MPEMCTDRVSLVRVLSIQLYWCLSVIPLYTAPRNCQTEENSNIILRFLINVPFIRGSLLAHMVLYVLFWQNGNFLTVASL